MSWHDRTASNPQHRAIVLLRMLFVIKLSPVASIAPARHPPSRGPGKVGGPGATKHQHGRPSESARATAARSLRRSTFRYVGNRTQGSVFRPLRAVGGATVRPRLPCRPTPLPPARESGPGFSLRRTECQMADVQLLLFACELRTRAHEILVRAANTRDLETQEMMHEVAASYRKLALQVEQRVRGADPLQLS